MRELLISAAEIAGERALVSYASTAAANGWLPLHVACYAAVSIDIIRPLVQIFPGGVSARTKDYRKTPSEILILSHLPEEKRLPINVILLGTEVNPPVYDLKIHPDERIMETFEKMRFGFV